MRAQSENKPTVLSAGKRGWPSRDWVFVCIWLLETVARVFKTWSIPDDFRHNWNFFNFDFVLQTDETPQGKRKKKAKKDADAPKRPMSGYMLWLSEIREQIKGENPGISVTELSKVAGEKWKKIEDKTVNDLCIPYISKMREWWLCKDFYSAMCISSRRSTAPWPDYIEQLTIFEGYFFISDQGQTSTQGALQP